jgi:predicted dehydrogenase
MKIAMIGSGNIAPFHIEAILANGLDLAYLASSPNSIRGRALAEKYKVPNFFDDAQELIEYSDWDGLVIVSSTEVSLEYLEIASRHSKPILIEKPVSLSSKELNREFVNSSKILVGYNRRFYENITHLKSVLSDLGPCLISVEVPQELNSNHPQYPLFGVLSNSVHVFDTLRYLCGDIDVDEVRHLSGVGTHVSLKSTRGDLISMILNYNAPANFTITVDSPTRRYVLKPFEVLTEYFGMTILEPDSSIPVRRYQPVMKMQYFSENISTGLKPGFMHQYQEFISLIRGDSRKIGASLLDAFAAVEVAERVIEGFKK